MRVAIYCRVSTLKQDYQRQVADLNTYCKAMGYDILYTFEEKMSGREDDRPEFKKLQKLTKDDVDMILVWEFSRLSRKAITLLNVINDFVQKGIQIYSYKDQRGTHNIEGKEDFATKIMIAFAAYMAEQELESIKERMMSGRNQQIENGGSPTTRGSFGYYCDDNMRLQIDPEEAEVVKRIFQMCIDGYSTKRIAAILSAENVPNSKFRAGNQRWLAATIDRMLSNTAYIGYTIVHKGKLNEMKVATPAIIDEETFIQAKVAKESRRTRSTAVAPATGYVNLLRGLVICAECGHRYTVSHGNYSCCTRSDTRSYVDVNCKAPSVNCRNIDYIIWDMVKNVCAEKISADKLQSLLTPLYDERALIDEQIKGFETKIEDLNKEIQKKAKVMLTLYEVSPVGYQSVLEEIKSIEDQVKLMQNEKELLELKDAKLERKINTIENNSGEISITEVSDKVEVIKARVQEVKVYGKRLNNDREVTVLLTDGRFYHIEYRFDYQKHCTKYFYYEDGNKPETYEYTYLPVFESKDIKSGKWKDQ